MTTADKINRLHTEASRHAVASRDSLQSAVIAAWQAGQLLLAEKKRVRRNMGGGGWLIWLEANFRGAARTAQRYMRLAKLVPDIAALPGLSLRQTYARLGIPTEPKNRREVVRLQPLPSYLLHTIRLTRSLRYRAARISPEQLALHCADLRPLYDLLHSFYESA